ncbi:30S ribosomal protein S20 [Campylobacter hyointestinalis]|uniref:Small ribosomal subunit protein bS20 n=1 Tax=Campylobacter hyointestinalis subsp. lawsonii TaxID=91353 RepID=A0AAV6EFH5_CAMHY|nr:30S ribosomal protein S20 [Campylobacter hyointestinalis]ANE33416.1 30S ribosomal protein S20 [Campylobacter hyointestinalis subsp. lawsonii CCUG 27631]KAB0613692.1 30S ribosomal protein S20 [Campylobacter hyointestinalis subsp. lawsonii]QKF68637.1 30S ribosomal protein S20 [Campylobacter hyointestinalis subsp. lawsonii]RAZ24530.1 30S ribosomal protein S20 [Campylobacter hyointestinalis subsp. lawsonii]RAZ29281.1 30S ribosomal protein S20 [Campylobacter hyointestinalis subsp. lawsonii]
MANHKSAEKRARQTIKRTERNRFYRTRLKNLTKAVRVAVAKGDKDAALLLLKDVNKNFHSFVSKGFLKKETASRKVSRLAKLVNTLAA